MSYLFPSPLASVSLHIGLDVLLFSVCSVSQEGSMAVLLGSPPSTPWLHSAMVANLVIDKKRGYSEKEK